MGYVRPICIAFFCLGIAACGAARSPRPLGEGRSQLSLSIGGPMIKEGIYVPAPYSVLDYNYGLTDKVNLHGAFHPSAAIYKTFVTDLGGSVEILAEKGGIPEILLDGGVIVATNFDDADAFPIITPIVSYQFGGFTPYVGVDNLFQFHENDRVWTPQVVAPFLGAKFLVCERWTLGAELKWSGINHDTTYGKIKHPSPFGTDRGDFAPYFFVSYDFAR